MFVSIVPKAVIATPSSREVKDLVSFVLQTDRDFATYIRLAGVTGARPAGVFWPG